MNVWLGTSGSPTPGSNFGSRDFSMDCGSINSVIVSKICFFQIFIFLKNTSSVRNERVLKTVETLIEYYLQKQNMRLLAESSKRHLLQTEKQAERGGKTWHRCKTVLFRRYRVTDKNGCARA